MPERDVLLLLSPHPDDIAISIGALVSAAAEHRRHLRIVTVFDGDGDEEVRQQHELARSRDRRAEDVRYATGVGAAVESFAVREHVYRAAEAQPYQARRIAERLCGLDCWSRVDLMMAPLGIGGHPDHIAVRRAAGLAQSAGESGPRLWLYEDLPYAARGRFRGWLGSSLTAGWVPVVREFEPTHWERKLASIEVYQSQLGILWPRPEKTCADELGAYASTLSACSYAERYWRRPDDKGAGLVEA